MMHRHHIIPRHMGGTDDPENIVVCTVSEHAEHHRVLFEQHGHEWDRIAWLSLSGQINVSEAKRLVQREAFKRGGDIARANRNANGTSIGDWCRKTGFTKTLATPEGMKKGGSKVGRMLVETGRFKEIREMGSKIGGKVANAVMRSQKWICLECGKIGAPNVLGWHTKKQGHFAKVRIV